MGIDAGGGWGADGKSNKYWVSIPSVTVLPDAVVV